ncbi:YtxH domain-containing protein [Oceanobacillus piezotolerans]|uniref:YtxH domain-containing protein n=1 Tax=Oceanobacillus piezotolerans TaxID=2448030 RepID=A0A498D935_9BACI|nr:YtxH domain-containing protein [Oceanobacillus piezotolerans]RLL47803.1 YtxH domain-containing protein [Oceanobacillus piezotolerans]
MSDNNINTKDFVIGTLVGSIVGASVALIFAPKSGKDLRNDINRGAVEVKGRASEWVDVAQVKGSDLKDKAYTTTSEFKRRAMDTTSQLGKNVAQKTQDLTKTVKDKVKQPNAASTLDAEGVVADTNQDVKVNNVTKLETEKKA